MIWKKNELLMWTQYTMKFRNIHALNKNKRKRIAHMDTIHNKEKAP